MAAPRKSDAAGDTKGKKVHDTRCIDPTSPYFDPIKALGASNVPLPFPGAVPFNNLAEYTTFVSGHRRNRNSNKDSDTSATRGTHSRKHVGDSQSDLPEVFGFKENDTDPKLDDKDEFQEGLLAIRRAKLNRNVLTRMERMEKGPLSLLLKCVKERLLVKVWIRGAIDLRGMCKGYIVAFDKHCNLAMMDVDELYKCPISRDKQMKKQKKLEKRRIRSLRQKISSLTVTSPDILTNEDTVGDQLPGENTLIKDDEHSQTIDTEGNQLVKGSLTNVQCSVESNIKGDNLCDGQSLVKTLDISSNDHGRLKSSVLENKSDVYSSSGEKDRTAENLNTISEKNLTKCPNYVQTEENIATGGSTDKYTSHENVPVQHNLLERHVNQLFIRGDNVVSVTVLE